MGISFFPFCKTFSHSCLINTSSQFCYNFLLNLNLKLCLPYHTVVLDRSKANTSLLRDTEDYIAALYFLTTSLGSTYENRDKYWANRCPLFVSITLTDWGKRKVILHGFLLSTGSTDSALLGVSYTWHLHVLQHDPCAPSFIFLAYVHPLGTSVE